VIAAPVLASGQFDSSFFISNLFSPQGVFLKGVWTTVYLAVISQVIGVLLGLPLALGRRSNSKTLRAICDFYSWLWRGTPLLLQLLIVYTGLSAANIYSWPDLLIGPVHVPGAIQAAIVTLSLSEAAYMCEIFRAAIGSVDRGQIEAAKSLGMTPWTSMRKVVLPQAARIVVPPMGSDFTVMLKSTSLLSVIGVSELFGTAQNINSATFKTFEIFAVAGIWYLMLTSAWTFIQARIEARLARSDRVVAPVSSRATLRERMIGSRMKAAR
jgi:polar amino acid transport system permease protein